MLSLQLQSVLYNNTQQEIIKSIESIENAIKNTHQYIFSNVNITYGDSSSEKIFTNDDIIELNNKFKNVNIEYVFFGFNSGTSKGHNILAENCSSDYIQIMNPDIILSPNFFDFIMKPFSNSNVGIVEARQVPIEHPKEYDPETGETGWASMACIVVPAILFKRLHGLDEKCFFMYGDDVDFSWRVRLDGKIIIYQPQAMVFHSKHLSTTCKWCPTAAEKYYNMEAELFIAYKWSNNKKVKMLLNRWKHASGAPRQVYQKFMNMKESGTLPPQLDPEGKVATFIGGYYSPNRFTM